MPNGEEVKAEQGAEAQGGTSESEEKEGGVKLVHKVYENDDKSMAVYMCCNIL